MLSLLQGDSSNRSAVLEWQKKRTEAIKKIEAKK
jgi:hypothetical protein